MIHRGDAEGAEKTLPCQPINSHLKVTCMKAVSASIVILSGSILMAGSGIARGEDALFIGAIGAALAIWGAVVWYRALAVEKHRLPTPSDSGV
jgi:hypothetical protein